MEAIEGVLEAQKEDSLADFNAEDFIAYSFRSQ